ncbi:MAG: potassium/proton antiporter [Lachnospiraceae bacterium]
MTAVILIAACILLLCVVAEKFSDKFGMPALILFMLIGILFGTDGFFGIEFSNFTLAENVCSVALIFIMFYGGFNTKWKAAKNVAGKAVALSTLGVVMTAGITAFLCRWLLKLSLEESFLIGAVLSSTDAASVFAILRKKKLNLKDGTASILEVESGSNDPASYLLTVIALSLTGNGDSGNVVLMVFLQLFFGVTIGILLAKATAALMMKTRIISEGLDMIFMIAMVMVCYGISSMLGGNAYLSVYLFGIFVGNSRIKNMKTMVPFFDGVTSLAQILIFFLIGLLCFPHEMPYIFPVAIAVVAIITLVARPIAVFVLMLPFRCSVRQCLLITWAGLRGASSSVFAIMAVSAGVSMKHDLFHIVFLVSLFSVAIQGTLLPAVSKRLGMVDDESDVRKTFNDYQEEADFQLMKMYIPEGHSWAGKKIKDVNMPTGSLALMIKRGKESIITRGDTEIQAGDDIILNVTPYTPSDRDELEERYITGKDPWCNQSIDELKLPENKLIVMVIRGGETIIPDGKTVLQKNDVVVICH